MTIKFPFTENRQSHYVANVHSKRHEETIKIKMQMLSGSPRPQCHEQNKWSESHDDPITVLAFPTAERILCYSEKALE